MKDCCKNEGVHRAKKPQEHMAWVAEKDAQKYARLMLDVHSFDACICMRSVSGVNDRAASLREVPTLVPHPDWQARTGKMRAPQVFVAHPVPQQLFLIARCRASSELDLTYNSKTQGSLIHGLVGCCLYRHPIWGSNRIRP